MAPVKTGFELGTVADAMTPGVLTCSPNTPLRTVAAIMATHRVHCVVVLEPYADEGGSWGVISDLDLVSGALTGFDETTAGAAAASPVVTVPPETPLDRAAQLMRDHASTHVLVIDPRSERPLGIVSTLDIARAVALDRRADAAV